MQVSRVQWTEAKLEQALSLLKTKTLKQAGSELGLTSGSLRKALMRAGVSVARFRKLAKSKAQTLSKRIYPHFTARRSVNPDAVVAIASLRPRQCRWAEKWPDETGFAFCTARRAARRPYCAAHSQIAYKG